MAPRSIISTAIISDLEATFANPKYQPPPLPNVAIQLVGLSDDGDVSAETVAKILERDQMLAAAVLRLASSPIFAGRSSIDSLRDAIVRLGGNVIRDLVFQVALSRGVFRVPEYSETAEQVSRHSTVTAYLSRMVCQRTGVDGDLAFISGLLHDLGFAAILFAVSHMEKDEAPPLSQFWGDISDAHEQASRIMCDIWELPRLVSDVVGHHHHLHTGDMSEVAAAISVADGLCRQFGADLVGPFDADGEPLRGDVVTAMDIELARDELKIDGKLWKAIGDEAADIVPDILWL